MVEMTRVYHPTLNSWQDVPAEIADAWAEIGWLKSKPKHVDDSEALPPGEGYTPPAVAVDDEQVVEVVEAAPPAKGKAAK